MNFNQIRTLNQVAADTKLLLEEMATLKQRLDKLEAKPKRGRPKKVVNQN